MFDPKQLMDLQKNLHERFETMQRQREGQVFEGAAGGGAVTAKVSGVYELLDLQVKPEAVDPDDIDLLQDLVVAAVNSALEKARKASEGEMSKITGGMKLPPFLGGL
jgi:DNA-binding YbaB/EbfC family protein